MSRRPNGPIVRDRVITVRLDEDEYAQVKRHSKVTGRTVSDLAREALLGARAADPVVRPTPAGHRDVRYGRHM